MSETEDTRKLRDELNGKRKYPIAWPEWRSVSETEMRGWALAAIHSGTIPGPADLDTPELAEQLTRATVIVWYGLIE